MNTGQLLKTEYKLNMMYSKDVLLSRLIVCLMCTEQCGALISISTSKDQATKIHLQAVHESADFATPSKLDRRSLLRIVGGASFGAILSQTEVEAFAASSSPSTRIPNWILQNGVEMPVLALNTVGLSTEDTERAITLAVKEGVTHIDFHPGKERDGVANYLRNNERTGLFLNTKIRKAPPGTSPEEAAERTRTQIEDDLQALGLNQVDMLMLRDSPDCNVIQSQWAVLEEALAQGTTRSVGVINFCEQALTCVLATAKVKPSLNYYLLHVGMGRNAHGLRTFGESRGIRTFAYGAIGEPGPNETLLNDHTLEEISRSHNRSPEEVAVRWVLQSGAALSVRPTKEFGLGVSACRADESSCENGIKARANSFEWQLTIREMAMLDGLSSPDDNPTLFSSSGCPGAFVMPNK